jgi:hypothetical protein
MLGAKVETSRKMSSVGEERDHRWQFKFKTVVHLSLFARM